jgi:hypothetical protein
MKFLATKLPGVLWPKDCLEYIGKCACYLGYCASMLTDEKIEIRCLGFTGCHMCLRSVKHSGDK